MENWAHVGGTPNIGRANGVLGASFTVILIEDHWTRSVRIPTTTCCKSQEEDECMLGRLAAMPRGREHCGSRA